ncbi:hypothetical protein D3C84_820750 [compost metagenome]
MPGFGSVLRLRSVNVWLQQGDMTCRVAECLDTGKGAPPGSGVSLTHQMQTDMGQVVPTSQQTRDHLAITRLQGIETGQPLFVGVQGPVITQFASQFICQREIG